MADNQLKDTVTPMICSLSQMITVFRFRLLILKHHSFHSQTINYTDTQKVTGVDSNMLLLLLLLYAPAYGWVRYSL